MKLLYQVLTKKYDLLGNNHAYDFFTGYYANKPQYTQQKEPVVYFVGLPEHGNIGDQAIAVATIEFIHKYLPSYYIHTIPVSKIIENLLRMLKHVKKEDIFVLIGGGNMGDVYFGEEEIRRIIIENFPHNKIIIFPQTIDYKDRSKGSELERSKKIYGSHKKLYLFAREQVSYHLMKSYYTKNIVNLNPDIVFSLDIHELLEKKQQTDTLLFCLRKDKESFMPESICEALEDLRGQYPGKVLYTDTVLSGMPYIEQEDIRKTIVFRKLKEFADAGIVITDRLHGMIFSALCHTPCIVIGNYNHKVISYYETWLRDCGYIYLLSQKEDLMEIIEHLKGVPACCSQEWHKDFKSLYDAWRK